MFANLTPKFEKGRILKTAMLESLRDYPRELAEIYYRDYADGIITGAQVEVGMDTLTVQPGLAKHGGQLYMLSEPVILAYLATGWETVVKVRFLEGTEDGDWVVRRSEIVLDERLELGADELELCRFKLKTGARLRQDYQNFRDLATEYNTVNLLHAPAAAYGQSTVLPAVMRLFGDELLRRGSTDPQDLAFAMMCLNDGVLHRSVILHYIASRLGMAYKDYDNADIHKYLSRILDSTRGGSRHTGMGPGGSGRVIVD